MRRRDDTAGQVEIPRWVSHFEVGLRHIGSVTEDGQVSLDGLPRLYEARTAWMAEHGLERVL